MGFQSKFNELSMKNHCFSMKITCFRSYYISIIFEDFYIRFNWFSLTFRHLRVLPGISVEWDDRLQIRPFEDL